MQITTWYLEQRSVDELRHAKTHPDLTLRQAEIPSPELSRFLYSSVGGDWFWLDRLAWTRDQWLSYLSRPMVETWVGYVRGTPAGYIELTAVSTTDSTQVQIEYFGLMPGFLGQGIGGDLLSRGIERAWELNERWNSAPVTRVWVHTCSLDGPIAMANYQARGLVLYRSEDSEYAVPEQTPGSWPGN